MDLNVSENFYEYDGKSYECQDLNQNLKPHPNHIIAVCEEYWI